MDFIPQKAFLCIYDSMKKIIVAAALFLAAAFSASAQDFVYFWRAIPVTSKYDSDSDNPVSRIVAEARKGMEYLNEVVSVSEKELASYRPESPLSNLTADMLMEIGSDLTGKKIDCSICNMGGIRIVMPKGDITLNDVVSCYPFKNTVVVLEITGKRLQDFFRDFAGMKQAEAIGGIRMKVSGDGKLIDVTVGGEHIDPERIYMMSTISFLLDGGDGFCLRNYSGKVVDTGIELKDAMLANFRALHRDGKTLDPVVDGRFEIVD